MQIKYLSDSQIMLAECSLLKMLRQAQMDEQICYRPTDIVRILNISYSTFVTMCNCWEPLEVPGRNKMGLENYRVGTHRRVPHHGLIEWLAVNMRNGED